MKRIWRVTVHCGDEWGYDDFKVEAKDDVEAKEKALALTNKSLKVEFVEINIETEFVS